MSNIEQNASENLVEKTSFTNEVKEFYTTDFKALILTFFKQPINGILVIFQNRSSKSYIHALILYVSVAVLYIIGGFMLAGDKRAYWGLSEYLKIALFPVLTMLAISVLSFGIKSVSGKINIKDELMTGALCGIPLGLTIPGMLIAKIFGADNVLFFLMNPSSGGGIIIVLLFLYVFLMLINVFQQSLKSANTNDTLAWYLSPVCISLAIYLASKVSENLF